MLKTKLKAPVILNLITRRNLSQNWLAHRMGISKAYLSQLITGARTASPKTRRLFLEYFNELSFDDLFEIEPDEKAANSND